MKARTFSIISALIAIFYSAGCFFFFSQPFWGFTSLCLGAVVSFYPIYFEKQRTSLLSQAQIAEYLSENLPDSHGRSVFKLKLASIKRELDSIEDKVVPLGFPELAEAVELRIEERLKEQARIKYIAVHIVDSAQSLGVWGKDYSDYPYLDSYVAVQQEILNKGGSVVRLFLFEPNWLRQNINECRNAVKRHDQRFAQCSNAITTLCGVIRRDIRTPKGDYSILDEQEVFFWERGYNPEAGVFMSGQYIIKPELVRDYLSSWRHLAENSFQSDQLFKLVSENKI